MDPIKGSICRSCRQRLSLQPKARSFSTSATRRVVPPESPYYVDIPSSYQPYLPFSKQQKGTLPVPRELFPASRPDKATPEYLANVTADPLDKNVNPSHKLTEAGRHKVKMSEVRRTQLREGLTGLHARKEAEINIMARASRAKQLQRDDLLKQAAREDARLTNVSTPQEMDPNSTASLAALEAEVAITKKLHEQKLANLERVQAEKHAQKMDALHTLYMNARKFITTEKQLDDMIKDQFDQDPEGMVTRHADFKTTVGNGSSMWNFGPPDSIKDLITDASNKARGGDMMSAVTSRVGKDQAAKAARFAKDQERMKKIAEKLSGGKM
ncbi:hypothetical protein PMZ80_004045 [Knufia obscura]|uniref:Uncharacterized protein n=1 Tax=Knufia obscura TaxID=1635080 RepID=A0ABR0RS21_9EURO|nr:hypothetical protein PMZ80_004045 [Knufia obscura]